MRFVKRTLKRPFSAIKRFVDRKQTKKLEAEHKAREEAERKAREEAERKAKEEAKGPEEEAPEKEEAPEEEEEAPEKEAARKAREEAERLAREEAEGQAREEAEGPEKEAQEEEAEGQAEEVEKEAKKNFIKEVIEAITNLLLERKFKMVDTYIKEIEKIKTTISSQNFNKKLFPHLCEHRDEVFKFNNDDDDDEFFNVCSATHIQLALEELSNNETLKKLIKFYKDELKNDAGYDNFLVPPCHNEELDQESCQICQTLDNNKWRCIENNFHSYLKYKKLSINVNEIIDVEYKKHNNNNLPKLEALDKDRYVHYFSKIINEGTKYEPQLKLTRVFILGKSSLDSPLVGSAPTFYTITEDEIRKINEPSNELFKDEIYKDLHYNATIEKNIDYKIITKFLETVDSQTASTQSSETTAVAAGGSRKRKMRKSNCKNFRNTRRSTRRNTRRNTRRRTVKRMVCKARK